jgi:hypothetical protein
VRKSTLFALAAIVVASVLIRLSPLLSFALWGSDVGEYFTILRTLTRAGHLPTIYAGWGITYPYFPGMFLVQDAPALLGPMGVATAVDLIIPILGGLAVLPFFLIGTEVTGDARIGLLAAAFLAVAMPHAYTTSHTAPASLGDLFAVTGLLLFLRLRRDPRVLVPLVLVASAVILTHHLSTYFLLIMTLAAFLIRNLVRPGGRDAGLRREVGFLAFFTSATFAFWVETPPFWNQVLHNVSLNPWWLLPAAFPVLVALLAGLILARRRVAWRFRPRQADLRHAGTMLAIAMAFLLGFSGLIALGAIPATTISVTPAILLAFLPFLLLLAFSAPGRAFLDFARDGLDVNSWLLALLGSSVVGIVAAPLVLIPYRHMEYLVMPLGLFAAVGFTVFFDLLGGSRRRKAAAVAAAGLLLAGNALIAIPPPALVAGWQEGIAPGVVDGALWGRAYESGLLAADHRASTIFFGFGGINATWDTTAAPFLAPDFATAEPGLAYVQAPVGNLRVRYVWLDKDTEAGVQLYPWEPAAPMSPAAIAKYSDSPFIKVYDSGYGQMYLVAWGCDGSC